MTRMTRKSQEITSKIGNHRNLEISYTKTPCVKPLAPDITIIVLSIITPQ